jgi:Gcd10p family
VAGANQQLTHADVRALKADKHGSEILWELEKGSSTFSGKTEFSQEKWRKRKSKKYLMYVTARRPTSKLIAQARFPDACASCDGLQALCLVHWRITHWVPDVFMHAATGGKVFNRTSSIPETLLAADVLPDSACQSR